MDTNKVETLLNKKREIEKQIDNIQSKCIHMNTVIKLVHKGSSHEVRWVCKGCSKVLGWPTEWEKSKFFGNS